MRDRLDFNDLPTSLAGRLTPSARVADALLRQTLTEGGCERFFEGGPRLVVVHGVPPDDSSVLCDAVHDLIGGTVECFDQLNASARDWTDLASQRPQYIERLLMDASVSTRPIAVLSRRRTEVPGVIRTVADGIIPLARSHEAIADIVREAAGFQPGERLVARLARLPLSFLNLAIRPGLTSDRMWRIAGRLIRHRPELERKRRPAELKGAKAKKPADACVAATPQIAP